ncbi:MAG: flagellar biosynthetic protein FliQ [Hyphomicrobium sp.]|nr:flagellar biosynthetic protein FliQ [Hyphomicrobium sp.]
MTQGSALDLLQQAIWVTMIASGPIVISAMVVGVIIAVLQALTQVQEMTLTFIPKMLVGFGVAALTGSYVGNVLFGFTEQVYALIGTPIQ